MDTEQTLEILAHELKQIAGGDVAWPATSTDMMMWAEGWLLTLVELGIQPALPAPASR